MLFLYRPRQTWMPFASPRGPSQQADYNRQLQERFALTRRRPPALPATAPPDPVDGLKELAALHAAGDLSDAEFQAAKAKLLSS